MGSWFFRCRCLRIKLIADVDMALPIGLSKAFSKFPHCLWVFVLHQANISSGRSRDRERYDRRVDGFLLVRFRSGIVLLYCSR